MAKALHVRGVPDELYEALRQAAEGEGRSISAQTIALLKGALAERTMSRAKILQNIERRRSEAGARLGGVEVARLIREDRDR